MALSLVTLNQGVPQNTVFGDRKVVLTHVQFDDSYVTGGEAFPASMFGMSEIHAVLPSGSAYTVSTGAKVLDAAVQWDWDAGTLVAVVPSTQAEVTNATDLSDRAYPVVVIGI